MKMTRHNGRSGKHGTYNPKHNDRRFDIRNSDHIDQERAKQNVYWDCYQGFRFPTDRADEDQITYSFEQIERAYYDDSLEDPYEYTRFLIEYQDLINQVDGRSLCRNKNVLRSCLKTLKNAGDLTERQKRLFFEGMCKRGGIKVLDKQNVFTVLRVDFTHDMH